MGELAEASIWAQQRGIELENMTEANWVAFYNEHDADAQRISRHKCPICGKKKNNVRQHILDFHRNAKGRAALAALDGTP